jgi:hypothetical protein
MEQTNVPATPIDYAKLMMEAAKQALSKVRPETKQISFKAGVLAYDGQAAPGNKLQVIVLGFAYENQWFAKAYDPKNIVSPTCWAVGPEESGLYPIQKKVTWMASDSCDTCPKNEWESDPKGGKGKACKNVVRLGLVVLPSKIEDLADADFLFAKLPVTSRKNWAKYVSQIGNVLKCAPFGVVTEISTVPDMQSQFKVNFKFVSKLPDEWLEHVFPMYERMGTEIMYDNGIDEEFDEADLEQPPPKAAPASAKAKK